LYIGVIITILCKIEVCLRLILSKCRFFQSLFRKSVTFDGCSIVIGRVLLLITFIHLFTYIGIFIWGRSVQDGRNTDTLYHLLSFNNYASDVVTMFQVLVVNDWHIIAQVFFVQNSYIRNSLIYPFFISANIICVNLLMNVLIAFFVEAFVSKVGNKVDVSEISLKVNEKDFVAFENTSKRSRLQTFDFEDTVSDGDDDDSSIYNNKPKPDLFSRPSFNNIAEAITKEDHQQQQ